MAPSRREVREPNINVQGPGLAHEEIKAEEAAGAAAAEVRHGSCWETMTCKRSERMSSCCEARVWCSSSRLLKRVGASIVEGWGLHGGRSPGVPKISQPVNGCCCGSSTDDMLSLGM
ncbi:hypothetical protein GOP47_0027720 [Adiantum capillus-veneris]|nr:hypothetical protein GOP47_0027720 [Adiantum capillus-veneris]